MMSIAEIVRRAKVEPNVAAAETPESLRAFCPACKSVLAVGERRFFSEAEITAYRRSGLTVEYFDLAASTTSVTIGKCECVVTRTPKLESAPPSDRAETHTPGPLAWKTFGKVGLFSESTKEIVLASDGKILAPNAELSALVEVRGDEPNARLLAAAYTSYDRHYGTGAVEAAESDQLGEALAALRALAPMFDNDSPLLTVYRAEIKQARAILARTTGAKP